MLRYLLSILFVFHIALASSFAQSARDTTFVLGTDMGWLTEYESKGWKCFDRFGDEREAMSLMGDYGIKAQRIRVWVDPSKHGGWCDKNDVLVKCKRAKALGQDIMIDFHYSDWWADPAKQNIPAAWAKHKYKQMLVDVAQHTKEVLQLLKDNGVMPRWVQVGNETSDGMLWPVGKLSENPKQYAGLFKAGYDAVKEICPEAKVIVHLDNGYKNSLYNENLDALRDNGAKWDMIGMSLYPYWARKGGSDVSAMRLFAECIQNIRLVSQKYGTDVMIAETGFEVDDKKPWVMECGRTQLAELIRLCKTQTGGRCKGVFYWEPTCRPNGYKLGAFSMKGHPTAIMRAFTTSVMDETLDILPSMRKEIKYDRPLIVMETTAGKIVMELYNETPKHRDNYIKIAKSGQLDGILIHRVMKDFMIQMGDPSSKTAQKTSADAPAPVLGGTSLLNEKGKEYSIPAEIKVPLHFHKRGALSAAREDDSTNPERRSSSSQFFISYGKWPTMRIAGSTEDPLPYYNEEMHAGVPYLDGGYSVFGEVIQGMDVVEKIQKVATDAYDRPLEDIRILKFEVKE